MGDEAAVRCGQQLDDRPGLAMDAGGQNEGVVFEVHVRGSRRRDAAPPLGELARSD